LLSLIIGFFVGFGLSWYRCRKHDDSGPGLYRGNADKDFPKDSGVVGNWYDQEPVKTFQSFSKDKGEMPPMKQHNINQQVPFYVNDLKPNNSVKVANSAVEATLQPPPRRHRTVHL
jgi:hypothetical protein